MSRNADVDAWLERYDNPMKPVVERIREIVLAADRRIDECIKWQAPTFTYRGNLASFFPKSKQHASLMFHTGATIPGDHPRLEGTGDTGRVMKIGSVAEANAAKGDISRIVRAWCDSRDAEAKPMTHERRRAATQTTQSSTPSAANVVKRSRAIGGGDGARRHDDDLAARVRAALGGRTDVVEKRMFGGLCFMVNGQMCCGLTKTDFMVRVGKDAYEAALAQPHARPMDFTGRPLAGMVYVDPDGLRSAAALKKWVDRAVAFVTGRAAPAPRTRKRRAQRSTKRPA